ncbi:MAG: DUF1501 domain-containing protein [Pirellulales bacterium]
MAVGRSARPNQGWLARAGRGFGENARRADPCDPRRRATPAAGNARRANRRADNSREPIVGSFPRRFFGADGYGKRRRAEDRHRAGKGRGDRPAKSPPRADSQTGRVRVAERILDATIRPAHQPGHLHDAGSAARDSQRQVRKAEGEFEFKNGRVLSNREGLDYELQLIARLIQADMGSRVYYVALDGFDTHGDQKETHANLLTNLADAVQSFYQTLTESEDAARVVLMTYSEFGRRVEENDSHGTDHGAGSNLFVIGPSVKGGLVGAPPSLKRDDLLSGDLAFHTDFRRVYATLLDNWLGCDSRRVLGEPFEHLKLLA